MIGPKCQLCGKSAKYHSAVYRLCPMGKRRKDPITGEIIYKESHPTNKFTPREPRKKAGSEKRKSPSKRSHNFSKKVRDVFKEIRADGCCACGSSMNVEIHHVLRRSQGGSNHKSNLLPLCADCHTQEPWAWHQNLDRFFAKFPHVWAKKLFPKGWTMNLNGRLIPPLEARSAYLKQLGAVNVPD